MNNAISSALSLAPIVLAQSPAIGATELGQWLLAGAAVAVIANQGFSFFRNVTGGFQRKQSTSDDTYTPTSVCNKQHTGLTAQIAKLSTDAEARSEKLRLELKDDVKGIHKRIDDVLRGVSRLEGKTSIDDVLRNAAHLGGKPS